MGGFCVSSELCEDGVGADGSLMTGGVADGGFAGGATSDGVDGVDGGTTDGGVAADAGIAGGAADGVRGGACLNCASSSNTVGRWPGSRFKHRFTV